MIVVPDKEEEEILLLKFVQSVVARQPKVEALAVLQVRAPATLESPLPRSEVK